MSTAVSEQSYYIMDYSSHYYKVNAKNQLVTAGDENEATVFSFADANRRIGVGVKSKFYCLIPVDTNDMDEVTEVFESISPVHELKEAEKSKALKEVEPITSDKYDLSVLDWEEYLTNLSYISTSISSYKEELGARMAEVDKKISDILHYIEFCDVDRSDSEDLVELLRVCRENRREYKDEIFKADVFQKSVGNSTSIAKINNAIKSIKGLENRKYKPREYDELFEGSGFRKKANAGDCVIEPEKRLSAITKQPEQTKEDIGMEYTRKETPFDGKENDWLKFAKKQAEFYENADQYIINKEIEMDALDDAIADLMEEIEQANCNVTQGYKMYKKLKELRLERKEKETELNALYILTDSFDMSVMKTISRRSAGNIGELFGECDTDYVEEMAGDETAEEEKMELQEIV